MEFITVDQFEEQSKEVQKVFLDWWKPSVGDIFGSDILIGRGVITSDRFDKEGYIPLFTEGQLRRFIEDKTNTDTILGISDCKEYVIALIKNDDELYEMIDTKETNLLQAYWKVACMVAKEEVNNNL